MRNADIIEIKYQSPIKLTRYEAALLELDFYYFEVFDMLVSTYKILCIIN